MTDSRPGERACPLAAADCRNRYRADAGQGRVAERLRECRGVSGASTGRFRLNRQRGKLMGVCAGMADCFGWDVTLVRVGWVAATLLGFGSLVLLYIAIGLIAD